jgi:hypothetical protein
MTVAVRLLCVSSCPDAEHQSLPAASHRSRLLAARHAQSLLQHVSRSPAAAVKTLNFSQRLLPHVGSRLPTVRQMQLSCSLSVAVVISASVPVLNSVSTSPGLAAASQLRQRQLLPAAARQLRPPCSTNNCSPAAARQQDRLPAAHQLQLVHPPSCYTSAVQLMRYVIQ